MKKLRAKKALSKYKNKNAAINAVYRENHKWIDERLNDGFSSPKSLFRSYVKDYMDEGMSLRQAIDRAQGSIRTKKEVSKANLLSAVKKDKDLYKDLRKATGWNTKVSADNMYFVKDEGNKVQWEYRSNGKVYLLTVFKKTTDNNSYVSVSEVGLTGGIA